MTNAELSRAEGLISVTADYPRPGVLFRDISGLIADGPALRAVVDALAEPFGGRFDIVAGIEARGFLLAGAVAAAAGVGVLPIRKEGKLPTPAASVDYELEYGTATIEAPGVLPAGARVLLVDDVLATGGTLAASRTLVGQLGGRIAGACVVLELDGLGGRRRAGEVHALFHA